MITALPAILPSGGHCDYCNQQLPPGTHLALSGYTLGSTLPSCCLEHNESQEVRTEGPWATCKDCWAPLGIVTSVHVTENTVGVSLNAMRVLTYHRQVIRDFAVGSEEIREAVAAALYLLIPITGVPGEECRVT